MIPEGKVLCSESNVISLRTAYVSETPPLVGFRLEPADLSAKVPKGRTSWAPKDFDWVKEDSVWLYRRLGSASEELKLKEGVPTVELGVKAMSSTFAPEFTFIWTDSGHSVAVCLNGEPWAFIDESSHQGYSKGIIHSEYAGDNPWDQRLFQKIFKS